MHKHNRVIICVNNQTYISSIIYITLSSEDLVLISINKHFLGIRRSALDELYKHKLAYKKLYKI